MTLLGLSGGGHPGDELRVTQYGDIRIVGREDELALLLGLAE